jgi:hypothetical protein
MSFFHVIKWCFGVILLLSIAWKIAIPPENPGDLEESLVGFFERNHFSVAVSEQMVNHLPLMQANAVSCHLQIASLTPDGSNLNLIEALFGDNDRLFVVFRGQVYAQQPISWTVLSYLWSRVLRELGFIRHISPVIAVAANSSCDAERLPWNELADVRLGRGAWSAA